MTEIKKSKARKTTTIPTKVYRYGLVPDHHRQMEPREEIEQQLRLGHQYRNQLVEIERERRDRYNALVAQYPSIMVIEQQMEPLQLELDQLIEGLKARRATARGRVRDPEVESRIADLKPQLRGLREDLKAAKRQLHDDPQVEAIQEWSYQANKEAYNASACAWGTKLKINDSMKNAGKGAPPDFRRYERCGMIAVQIQSSPSDRSKGCTTQRLLAGTDTRVRLFVSEEDPREAELWLRIGTEEGGRNPTWATFGVVLHRPIPQGEIKWVWVQRVQAESKGSWGHADDARTWEVCFSLESVAFDVPMKLMGPACALNFGFRKLDNGRRQVRRHRVDRENGNRHIPYTANHEFDRLRVAFLVGTDGNRQEIMCQDIWTAIEWAAGRRSNRDLDFDRVKPQLIDWLATAVTPEWLQTRTRTLPQWRSCASLNALMQYWRSNRFPGDESIYDTLYSWAQRDRHGRQHECGVRDRAYGRRLDRYRCVAHEIASRYSVIRVPRYNLAEMKRTSRVGEHESDLERVQRRQLNTAAIFEFVQALKLAASNTGARIEEFDVVEHPVSITHHACGRTHGADRAPSIMIHCPHCRIAFDQDANAAQNLLSLQLAQAAE